MFVLADDEQRISVDAAHTIALALALGLRQLAEHFAVLAGDAHAQLRDPSAAAGPGG